MFNLFNKKQLALIRHQHKNLLISFPSHWKYELEQGDQEACFDPKSQSTQRLNIIKVISHKEMTTEDTIKSLTNDQPYITTPEGYLLTGPVYKETTEDLKNITLVTWKLINYTGDEKIVAVLTYTVLSEKDLPQEKEIFKLIEKSLRASELS
jgi:hypothetical protein